MFDLLLVQPILNALILILAVLPGNNFGLALIIFTILIRLAMHPLIKKHLHHSKAMRELQPEITKIKKATKDDPQETSRLIMELYKEREVSPLAGLAPTLVQVAVLIGLYTGLRHIADDPSVIINDAYSWIKNLGAIQTISSDISQFDFTLFGIVDLSRAASGGASGSIYIPGLILVIGSAVAQYFMGSQTLPKEEDARTLRQVLKDSRSGGKKVEGSEIQGLFTQSLKYLIPLLIFLFTYSIASALALYWLSAGVVGYIQQRYILNQDKQELLSQSKSSQS